MTKKPFNSRQRMLNALACLPADHVPCAFMLFKGLQARRPSYLDFLSAQLELGLDVVVQIPPRLPQVGNDHYNLHGLPVSYDRSVQVKEWKETRAGEALPTLVKEYHTPAGTLRAEVRQTPDWPYGEHVPFLDDYIEPRSIKFLVESPKDLEALRHLLVPPTQAEIGGYFTDSQPCLEFARQKGLLVAGGWGVGADMIGWLSGLMNMIRFTRREPEFIHSLLDLIAAWNQARMQVVLAAGVDLYIKRAWYENCDFWTPTAWKQFIQPILKQDVKLAHERGARFGYILTASGMPLIEAIIEAGVDVLIGVDPNEYDLRRTLELSRGKLCLWGGVNGHLAVEGGSPAQVREETEACLRLVGSQPGFILSPVDNVREYNPAIEANVRTLIKTWRELAG
jgi:hypothetical protein